MSQVYSTPEDADDNERMEVSDDDGDNGDRDYHLSDFSSDDSEWSDLSEIEDGHDEVWTTILSGLKAVITDLYHSLLLFVHFLEPFW